MVKKLLSTAKFPFLPTPKPARVYTPDWYKQAGKFTGGQTKPSLFGGTNRGLKLCVPFLDALVSGYVVELWMDLEVRQSPEGPQFAWVEQPDVLTKRESDPSYTLPTPAGHNSTHYAWLNPYIFKTPPGYSLLISHPFNRFDLPFTTLTGVVDADNVMMHGKLPFFLKEGFEGIIPAGTPLFQVLPFKRDDWKVVDAPELETIADKLQWLSARVANGFYKANLWKKKNYN